MKKLSTKFCGSVALGICLTAAPGLLSAQTMSKMGHSADTKFAMDAAHGGAAEVALGKLAEQKATDPDVKAFGQLMVHDHSEANDKLMNVAKDESMTLPSTMDAKQQAMYDKLSAMSGASFDKAYVHDMVKDHEEDIKEFQKEANSGSDPQVKNFASQTLPILQGHLEKIKAIQSKMGSSAKGM